MRHIGGVCTQLFNRRHGHDGQLFRGRSKALLDPPLTPFQVGRGKGLLN
jgi:hypothetical protein